jgi:hypothetical protein
MGAQGDKWRAHRRAFELAVAHRIPLREAKAMLRRDARQLAEQRMALTQRSLAARDLPPPSEQPSRPAHQDFDAPWMMRN